MNTLLRLALVAVLVASALSAVLHTGTVPLPDGKAKVVPPSDGKAKVVLPPDHKAKVTNTGVAEKDPETRMFGFGGPQFGMPPFGMHPFGMPQASAGKGRNSPAAPPTTCPPMISPFDDGKTCKRTTIKPDSDMNCETRECLFTPTIGFVYPPSYLDRYNMGDQFKMRYSKRISQYGPNGGYGQFGQPMNPFGAPGHNPFQSQPRQFGQSFGSPFGQPRPNPFQQYAQPGGFAQPRSSPFQPAPSFGQPKSSSHQPHSNPHQPSPFGQPQANPHQPNPFGQPQTNPHQPGPFSQHQPSPFQHPSQAHQGPPQFNPFSPMGMPQPGPMHHQSAYNPFQPRGPPSPYQQRPQYNPYQRPQYNPYGQQQQYNPYAQKSFNPYDPNPVESVQYVSPAHFESEHNSASDRFGEDGKEERKDPETRMGMGFYGQQSFYPMNPSYNPNPFGQYMPGMPGLGGGAGQKVAVMCKHPNRACRCKTSEDCACKSKRLRVCTQKYEEEMGVFWVYDLVQTPPPAMQYQQQQQHQQQHQQQYQDPTLKSGDEGSQDAPTYQYQPQPQYQGPRYDWVQMRLYYKRPSACQCMFIETADSVYSPDEPKKKAPKNPRN